MFDAAAGINDFVRAHRSVTNENELVVRSVFVCDLTGRNSFAVTATIVLPQTFIDEIVKVKILKMFEFTPCRGKHLLANSHVIVVSCYTPAGDVALWFMYQPLLMNKSTFEGLNADQQAALLAASEKAQVFYLEEAKKEDAASAEVFKEAGVEIAEMSAEDFEAWRALAQETSYKAFVEEVPDGQALLDMALAVE